MAYDTIKWIQSNIIIVRGVRVNLINSINLLNFNLFFSASVAGAKKMLDNVNVAKKLKLCLLGTFLDPMFPHYCLILCSSPPCQLLNTYSQLLCICIRIYFIKPVLCFSVLDINLEGTLKVYYNTSSYNDNWALVANLWQWFTDLNIF